MASLAKLLQNPAKIIHILDRVKIGRLIPDKAYLKLRFRADMGKKLNLKNPETYNEKLQWMKLYDRNPLYVKMVDKHEVKAYVSEQIGQEYVIPTLGVWDKVEDIDFDALPERFVLKCTHDSGGLVICKDKSKLNIEEAKQKLCKSLKNNFFYVGREWPYKNVKPRIIAETFMEDTETAANEVVIESDAFSIYAVVLTGELHTTFEIGDSGETYRITVSYGPEAEIPDNAELEVSEITADSDAVSAYGMSYEDFVSHTENALGMEAGSAGYIRLFDIKIVGPDGEKVEIAAPVDVKIELVDKDADGDFQVVHFADGTENGDVVEDVIVDEESISFAAEGFSVYAIVDDALTIPTDETQLVQDLDELKDNFYDSQGFILSYGGNNFFTNGLNSKGCYKETTRL